MNASDGEEKVWTYASHPMAGRSECGRRAFNLRLPQAARHENLAP